MRKFKSRLLVGIFFIKAALDDFYDSIVIENHANCQFIVFTIHTVNSVLVRIIENMEVYIFIAACFFSATVNAIALFPDFNSHYQLHNKEHHKISLIDFIFEHVGEKVNHEEKHEKIVPFITIMKY